MAARLSPRLAALVDALPLRPDARVLEVGCGPGAAARAVADRLTTGQVLAVDRSAAAVEQAVRATADRPDDGRLRFRHVAAEDLALEPGEQPYDVVFAFRVGALDGRHPALGVRVLEVGCGPGAAARAVAERLTTGSVLAASTTTPPRTWRSSPARADLPLSTAAGCCGQGEAQESWPPTGARRADRCGCSGWPTAARSIA